MGKLTIVAHITASEGNAETVKAGLEKLIAPSRADRGCLQYDLHQAHDNPAHFMFYENWSSRDEWLAHMEQPHLATWRTATEGMIADFRVYEMTHLA